MSLCTDICIVNNGINSGRVASLKCKRWTCPECAIWCRRRVIAKGREGNPTKFLTLTWRASRRETPDEAARLMKTAWVNLRRRIAKRWPGRKTPFLAVFEKHESGYPHMHILLRCPFIPQSWLSQNWEELTDAFKVDIRDIKNKQHYFFYITKYLGKDPWSFEGCKRWWRSHDYAEDKEEPYVVHLFGDRIERERTPFHDMLWLYSNQGHYIDMEGHSAFRWERSKGIRWNPRKFGSFPAETSPGQSARADCGCQSCLANSTVPTPTGAERLRFEQRS